MDRRTFLVSNLGLILAGCGGSVEYQVAPSPIRTDHGVNTPVAGYAQGRFTPSLGGNATYHLQVGNYEKLGRRVFFTLDLNVNVLGTGHLTLISGLPFTSIARDQLVSARVNQVATAVVSVFGVVLSGTNTVRIASRTAANADDGFNNIFQDGAIVTVDGSYQT